MRDIDLEHKLSENQLVNNRFYDLIITDSYWGVEERIVLRLNDSWAYMFSTVMAPSASTKSIITGNFEDVSLFLEKGKIEIYNVTDWVNDLYFELLSVSGYRIVETDKNEWGKELKRYIFDREFDVYQGDKCYGISLLKITRLDKNILDVIERPNSIYLTLDILSDYNVATNSYFGIGGREYLMVLPFDDENTALYNKWRETYMRWYSSGLNSKQQIDIVGHRFRNHNLFNIINNNYDDE